MSILANRMAKELKLLAAGSTEGICAWPKQSSITQLEAVVFGPSGTPYEDGKFKLSVTIPDRYPFEPPKICFITPIYHPNIDSEGRICLDVLNMPPKGAWKPSLNVMTLLLSIRVLLSEPNPDDGLVPDITDEYKYNKELFTKKAIDSTRQHACKPAQEASCSDYNQNSTTDSIAASDQNHTQTSPKAPPAPQSSRPLADSTNVVHVGNDISSGSELGHPHKRLCLR